MKKIFLKSATLMMATVAVVTMFTSCREDEDWNLEFDKDILSTGVVADIDGGFYHINIKSNSAWTAKLPEDCDWAGLLKKSGKGDAKLSICIDPNYTQPERTAILTLSNEENSYEIIVRQETSDKNAGYYNIAETKGLGFGYDPKTLTVKPNAIFCLEAMDSLKKQNKLKYSNLFVGNRTAKLEAINCNVDSVEEKKDSLQISLSLDIAYSNFKFGIHGGYTSDEERKSYMKEYKTAAKYPTLETKLGYRNAITHYQQWVNSGMPEDDLRGYLLSIGFAYDVEELVQACNSANVDSTKLKRLAMNIISDYGPTVVVNTQLGGSFSLQFHVDSIWTKDYVSLDSVEVAASMEETVASQFSFDANVKVKYHKSATEILKHSICSCVINGGSKDDMESIYECFQNHDYSNLNTVVGEWMKNVQDKTTDSPDTNLAELINLEIVPIWLFVNDTYAQRVLRSCALEAYKDVKEMQQLAKHYL